MGYYIIEQDLEQSELRILVRDSVNQEIPEDSRNLAMEVGSAFDTIKLIYKKDKISFNKAFSQLVGIAKIGLENNPPQTLLASSALSFFKKEVVDRESGKVKNNYLKKLGLKSLIIGLPALLIGVILNAYLSVCWICMYVNLESLANFLIMIAGTMTGVWLSFAITRTQLNFDDLAVIEKDRLEPMMRLVFTAILAIVFGLFFLLDVIEIKLGEFSSSEINDNPIVAYLIGAILGLNEKIIGSTLTKKTSSLMKI